MKRGLNSFNSKRGQMTLFIILGISIFVISIAIYAFTTKPEAFFKGVEEDPQKYIQLCVEDDLDELINIVSRKGGSLNPEFYFEYDRERIAMLCYTSEDYTPCKIQEPFLKQHIELELTSAIKDKVESCFDKLEEEYEKEGYSVELKRREPVVKLRPMKVLLKVENKLTITKEKTSEYSNFNVPIYTDLYTLVGVASSMLEWEQKMGEADVMDFMSIYYDLNIKKIRGSDGRKVYRIKKRDTGEEFQFATRSLVFPPGM